MRYRWLGLLLVATVCAISYANSLPNGFVWDDNMFIRDNYFIRDFSNITKVFGVDFWETSVKAQKSSFYRPLITASLIVDYAVWKFNPFGYHLTNLLFFTMCCIMVWLASGFFLSRRAALTAGILFAVHVIHTESVTFILGRTDVLAGCFMFAAMFFFLRSDSGFEKPLKSVPFWVSVVLFCASLFCKEASVMALPIFCAGSACRRGQSRPFGVKRLAVMMIPYALVILLYLIVRRAVYAGPIKYEHLPPGGTMLNTMLTMPKIVLLYIYKLFFPVALSIDYQPAVVTSFFSPMFIIPVLVVSALGLASLIRSVSSTPAYGGFCFFTALFPVMNFIPIGLFMADRFVFIPSFGFVLLAGWVFERVATRINPSFGLKIPLTAILAVILCLTVLTVRRNADWRDELRLWVKTARTTPASFRAHGSLGQIFLNKGMISAALSETNKALLFRPNDSRVLGNMGIIYMKMNNYNKAVEFFEKSLKYDSTDFRTHANLYSIYATMGQQQKALNAITRALECNPGHLELWKIKVQYLVKIERYDEALKAYVGALEKVQPDAELLFGLADLYKNIYNNYDMAAKVYKKILSLEPGNTRAKQLFYESSNKR